MKKLSGRINGILFQGRVEVLCFGPHQELRGCGRLQDPGQVLQQYYTGKALTYEGLCRFPDGRTQQVCLPITLWSPDPRLTPGDDLYFEGMQPVSSVQRASWVDISPS